MAHRPLAKHSRSGGAAIWIGILLILLALAALGAIAYFYFVAPKNPRLDPVSLCPVTGPYGLMVVLVDTTNDLPDPAQRQVLAILDDLVATLPEYYRLDMRVLDVTRMRSQSIFAKCNPGDGTGLSEWTGNPRIARLRWIESFHKPATDAIRSSIVGGPGQTSPIMAAIQDIALDEFSRSAARPLPKTLIVISDMIEHTRDYSQYGGGDLSFERYRRSPAYQKYQTDLHGAHVTIEYVFRASSKIGSVGHIEFWKDWINDNGGVFERARRLQGAG